MASIEESGIDRWYVGGGASHTPEAVRRMLYTATGGASGVSAPNALLVRPLDIPGAGVRILTGSALIRSKFVGGADQTYQATAYRQQELEIPENASGSTRHDLVIMNVEDPFVDGSTWPEPLEADIPQEQYVYPRVITGVPASAKKIQQVPGYENYTAETLFRVSLPALTGTVLLEHLTDLRRVAIPRRSEVVYARPRVATDGSPQQNLNGRVPAGEYFPGGAGYANEFQAEVPEWATRMVIDARWMSVYYANNKDPFGSFWVEYGDEYKPNTWPNSRSYEYATQLFAFNSVNSADARTDNWSLMDEVTIPAKYRGKLITFVFKAGLHASSVGGSPVWMSASGGLGMRITFAEQAIDSDLL